MRKLIKDLFYFSLLSIVIYITLVVISGQFLPGPLSKNLIYKKSIGFADLRFNEADKINNIDVLVLGSSLAYRGYDPRIFQENGFKIFNLGSSSQSFVQTKFLIDNFLETINPKFVILDVYPRQFENSGIESSADIISNISLNSNILKMVLQQNDLRTYNTFIFSFYNQYIRSNIEYKSPNLKTDLYIPGGYIENITVNEKSVNIKDDFIDVRADQMKAFESIISIF
ncbi:hypothetical protein [Cyclobacterium qasimii]|nr:hypothetical protein [Cyclobacterium qasimii]EPR66316.1 hypothetical protein ADICYQ_4658 [Cyclobacterium qasimii M12-11B]